MTILRFTMFLGMMALMVNVNDAMQKKDLDLSNATELTDKTFLRGLKQKDEVITLRDLTKNGKIEALRGDHLSYYGVHPSFGKPVFYHTEKWKKSNKTIYWIFDGPAWEYIAPATEENAGILREIQNLDYGDVLEHTENKKLKAKFLGNTEELGVVFLTNKNSSGAQDSSIHIHVQLLTEPRRECRMDVRSLSFLEPAEEISYLTVESSERYGDTEYKYPNQLEEVSMEDSWCRNDPDYLGKLDLSAPRIRPLTPQPKKRRCCIQ